MVESFSNVRSETTKIGEGGERKGERRREHTRRSIDPHPPPMCLTSRSTFFPSRTAGLILHRKGGQQRERERGRWWGKEEDEKFKNCFARMKKRSWRAQKVSSERPATAPPDAPFHRLLKVCSANGTFHCATFTSPAKHRMSIANQAIRKHSKKLQKNIFPNFRVQRSKILCRRGGNAVSAVVGVRPPDSVWLHHSC